jgi:hypothetical protein
VNPIFSARGEPLLQGFGGGLATGGEQGGEELILEFPASAVDDFHVGHGGLAKGKMSRIFMRNKLPAIHPKRSYPLIAKTQDALERDSSQTTSVREVLILLT